LAARHQDFGEPRQGVPAGFRVSSVESADADGDSKVEESLTWFQHEILGRHAAIGEAPGGDFGGRPGYGLPDRGFGTVDCQHMAVTDAPRDLAGQVARPAADFEYALPRLKGPRFDDLQ
jgi:hypothetical protein